MPYLLMYTHILLSMWVDNSKIFEKNKLNNKKQHRFFELFFSFEFSFTLLFLFAALRGNGDADYFNYINGVAKIQSIENLLHPVNYPFEFGFRFLSLITNKLNANPQLVIAMMNLISFSMVYYFINKHSKNRLFSLMIFFPIVLLFDMHHSRSAIAISSGLMFFDSIYEKKYIKTALFFLLGMLFHKSTIIILILITVPIISKEISKIKSKNIFKYSLIFIFILMIVVSVFNPFSFLLKLLDNELTYSYYYKLSAYLANERWSYKFSLFDPRLILMIIVFVICGSQYKKSSKFVKNLIVIQFFTVVSILFLRHSTILVIRIYNFFNIFTIVSIPTIISSFDEKLLFNSLGVNENSNSLFSRISREHDKVYKYQVFIVIAYILYTLALITKQVDYMFFF